MRTENSAIPFVGDALGRSVRWTEQERDRESQYALPTETFQNDVSAVQPVAELLRHLKGCVVRDEVHRAHISTSVRARELPISAQFVQVMLRRRSVIECCTLKKCTHEYLFLCRNWKEGGQLSLESHVYYLLNEVKIPPPGYSLSFYLNHDYKVTIRTPDLEELPLCDFPIREIFYLIDVDTVLYLFTSILLENQVLICSSSKCTPFSRA